MRQSTIVKFALLQGILVLLSASAAFFLAEWVYRKKIPLINPMTEQWRTRRPSPYTMFSRFAYGQSEPKKARGELRVFILGGSTVEAGRPPLPEMVGEELRRRGVKNVRVFNYGVVSQKSSQELAHIVFHVLDSEPDIVVMYDGGNDIMDPFILDPRPGYPFNFAAYENNVFFLPVETYPGLALLAYNSGLLRRAFRAYFTEKFGGLAGLRKANGYGTEPWREKIAEIYVDNLLKADRICRAFNAEFLAVFQPLADYKRAPGGEGKDDVLSAMGHASRVRALIRRRVEEAAPRTSLRFCDLSDIFVKDSGAVFKDYIHVYDEFNQVIAGQICDRLVPIISERRRITDSSPR